MAEITLYSYFRSSASYRVRIALEIKGLPYDYKAIHLLQDGGKQYTTEYGKLNPAHEVPTLIHGGNTLGQSMAIIEYLDQVYPTNRLFPADPGLGAKVRQFCETINCLQPLQNLATVQFLTQELKISDEQKQLWLNKWMHKAFKALEAHLTEYSGTYCFGETLTAADCFLVPQIFSAHRFHVSTESFPKMNKIYSNLEKLDAFARAHPLRQPDTPKES